MPIGDSGEIDRLCSLRYGGWQSVDSEGALPREHKSLELHPLQNRQRYAAASPGHEGTYARMARAGAAIT